MAKKMIRKKRNKKKRPEERKSTNVKTNLEEYVRYIFWILHYYDYIL